MPGKWEKRLVPVRTLATGHTLTTTAFVCHGAAPRPLAYIQANVHGAELQGNAAILALFDLLANETPRGTLVIVPRVNPVSANQDVGGWVQGVYDAVSGVNFNRGYLYLTGRSREAEEAPWIDCDAFAAAHRSTPIAEIPERFRETLRSALSASRADAQTWGLSARLELALAIQEMAVEADVVLDLHTGDATPRYLYVPEGAHKAARAFGIPFVLEVAPRFGGALDEASFVPWHDLAEAFRHQGREDVPRFVDGFTVELGSMASFSLADGIEDARTIANALRYYGVLDGTPAAPNRPQVACLVEDYKSLYAPASGLVDRTVAPGTAVKKGDLIARIVDPLRCGLPPRSADAITEVRAPEDGVVLLFHAYPSVHKGTRLASMMTRVRGI